jgi:hypothetical protein
MISHSEIPLKLAAYINPTFPALNLNHSSKVKSVASATQCLDTKSSQETGGRTFNFNPPMVFVAGWIRKYFMHVTSRKAWPAKLYLSSFGHLLEHQASSQNRQLRCDFPLRNNSLKILLNISRREGLINGKGLRDFEFISNLNNRSRRNKGCEEVGRTSTCASYSWSISQTGGNELLSLSSSI